jgi:hypothetical protein
MTEERHSICKLIVLIIFVGGFGGIVWGISNNTKQLAQNGHYVQYDLRIDSSTIGNAATIIPINNPRSHQIERRFGYAWIFLCVALALHVTDEALTDFLSVYNPTVLAIRKRLPFLPLPTFTFGVWLTGLIIGILLLFCLSPFVFRGSRFTIWLAYPLSVIMFLNGMGHIGGSLYRRRLMPGVYSSPFLLFASAYLFVQL